MANQGRFTVLRIPAALIMGLAISVITLRLTRMFSISEDSFVPSSFFTHTFMWFLSVVAIYFLTKGKIGEYGFTRGKYRLTPRIFLWVLPTAILSVLGFIGSRLSGEVAEVNGLIYLQDIMFIWIYSSISEEIFTRGLLQSFLSPMTKYGFVLAKKWRISLPVLFSGLYFGAMHIVLVKRMGPAVLMVMTMAAFLGIVAGYHREKTESLIPAIIIHALFNVGGALPMWFLRWVLA
jgi:membrane protease YdiL (CAAX protease family)